MRRKGLRENITRRTTKVNSHMDTPALQDSSIRRERSTVQLNVRLGAGGSILEIQVHNMLKERNR